MVEMNLKWLRQSTEIPIFLTFYGFFLCAPIDTNFIIFRTCYVWLGYDKIDCEKLGSKDARNSTGDLEKLVQPHANLIILSQATITNIIPAITYLFVGAWSDRNGRKPVMLFAITGFLYHGAISLIVALNQSSSPWYLLTGSVPAAFLGRIPQLMMVMVCYTIDNTDEENRGLRIGIIESIPAVAIFLGTLSSSFIFEAGGYILVYSLDIICNLFAFLYVLLILTETSWNTTESDKIKVYSFENISEMIQATFKLRINRGRSILLITLLISTLCVLVGRADGTVTFQFLREKLKWDLQHYTLYSSVATFLGLAAMSFCIGLLHKVLNIAELPLMTLGISCYFCSAVILGFGLQNWHIYLAGGLKSIYVIFNPMFRSFVSKLISSEETGKVFSLAVTVDAIVAMLAGPLYVLIYNHTLNINSGIFNFITAGICGINLLLITIVILMRNSSESKSECRTTLLAADESSEHENDNEVY